MSGYLIVRRLEGAGSGIAGSRCARRNFGRLSVVSSDASSWDPGCKPSLYSFAEARPALAMWRSLRTSVLLARCPQTPEFQSVHSHGALERPRTRRVAEAEHTPASFLERREWRAQANVLAVGARLAAGATCAVPAVAAADPVGVAPGAVVDGLRDGATRREALRTTERKTRRIALQHTQLVCAASRPQLPRRRDALPLRANCEASADWAIVARRGCFGR